MPWQKFDRTRFIYIYIYVCVPCFNGTWKQLECRHVRRFACKEERAKCNLDYHSNQDLCTASAYASGCDSLENCLRCWYWKFMRITSAGDAEVTARARASPRPKPFVADENYTLRNRLTALLSMTPPFIYIFFSLFLSFFIPSSLSFSSRMSKHSKKEKEKKFRRLLHSLVRFFHTFFHSFSQLCHYIVCSDALRSVCVSQRECVRFISYIFYIFFLSLSFFTRNRMREKRTRSISFLRVESLLLLVTASKGIRYRHGLQEK